MIKGGYVNFSFGAKRPGRPGTPIALVDGQQLTGVSLGLQRASVITGTILDQNGAPASGMSVSALRYAFTNGERRLVPAASSSTGTDDRGAYRIWGLAAGDYVVAASVSRFGGPTAGSGDMRVMTDADIGTALQMLRSSATASSPPSVSRATGPEPMSDVPTVGYSPVFYPGTATASQAGTIAVGIGEERRGVDFQLQLVATAKVEGTLQLPDGTPARTGSINMISTGQASVPGMMFENFRTARPDSEGRFVFSGLTPGQYAIVSRGSPPGATPPPPGPAMSRTPPLWASTDIAVDGQSISGITLTLQQGMTLSGRVVLEGSTVAPPPLTRLTVNLQASQTSGEVNLGVSAATVDANGQFTITGVTPGRYRLTASVPGSRPDAPGWVMKSSTMDGQDTLDLFYSMKRSVEGAVVTLTDTPTELMGTVQDAAGQPAPEHQIIVFAADKQFWTPQSRRIQSVRPASSGKYSIRNLPPGEYYLAAVIDAEPGEWFDPAFLQQLTSAAFRITLSEGEKKTQDVRVGGGF